MSYNIIDNDLTNDDYYILSLLKKKNYENLFSERETIKKIY